MKVKGVSNLGQIPDYLELKVSTLGKCYKSAKESNSAAEKALARMKLIIQDQIKVSSGDQLIVTAGRSSRQKETTSIFNAANNRNETLTLCEKGWRSSREIIIKFSDLNLFELLNPKLLSLIDEIELENRVDEKGSISATIHAPIPRLMPKTIIGLEENALKESLINASKKFQIVKNLCNLVNVSIEEINEASSVIRHYRDGSDDNTGDGSLNFALQYVHLAYNITFSFDNTSGECLAAPIL
jgi:hypothetical protein